MRHDAEVVLASFSPDGTRIATGARNGAVRLWDGRSGRATAQLRGHEWEISSAVFSPDGTRVATASRHGGPARIWDAASGAEISRVAEANRVDMYGGIQSAAFSPDGTRLVIADSDDVRIFDVASGWELARLFGHLSAPSGAVFSADGARLVTAAGVDVQVWDVSRANASMEALATIACATFLEDGERRFSAEEARADWLVRETWRPERNVCGAGE
jgi:WD40 repeat protein